MSPTLSGGSLRDHAALEDLKTVPAWVREAVLDRDNAQCQVCGTTGDNRLQLHHVQFRSQGGGHAPENLITLCFRDHAAVHDGTLEVELLEVSPDRWSSFWKRL